MDTKFYLPPNLYRANMTLKIIHFNKKKTPNHRGDHQIEK